MSSRQQNVRTYSPVEVKRFDDQFWPILMALCITSAILAATLVTLLSGFWMWLSLLVLPAAVMGMLITLLLTGNKRLRRSFQLAIILSLAGHCIFVIYAKQTRIFTSGLPVKEPVTRQIQPTRSIRVAQTIPIQPWLKENKVPQPDTPEAISEKAQPTSTPTVQRSQNSPQAIVTPDNNSALQRRTTQNSVAHLGANRSARKRRTRDEPIRSDEKASKVPNTPGQRTTNPTALQPETTRLMRNEPPLPSPAKKKKSAAATRLNSEIPKTERQKSQTTDWKIKQNQRYPRKTETTRMDTSSQPIRMQNPRISAAAPTVSESAANLPARDFKRKATATAPTINKTRPQQETDTGLPPALARKEQTRSQAEVSVTNQANVSRMSRSPQPNPQPLGDATIEKASPTARPARESGLSTIDPQPVALKRATNGIAGVGQTPNTDRAPQSRMSSGITASDALKRRQETSQDNDRNSLSLRQKSSVPRVSGAAEIPRSVNRPDTIPIASRNAMEKPAEWTANSSAALSQANATAKRGKSSLAKGSGSIDRGPTKIVSKMEAQRVSGGGRPKIQLRHADSVAQNNAKSGAENPELMAEQPVPIPKDQASQKVLDAPSLPNLDANEKNVVRSRSSKSKQTMASAESLKLSREPSTTQSSSQKMERANNQQASPDRVNPTLQGRGEAIRQDIRDSMKESGVELPETETEIARINSPATENLTLDSARSNPTEVTAKAARNTAAQATDRMTSEHSQLPLINETESLKPTETRSPITERPSVSNRKDARQSTAQKREQPVVIAEERPTFLAENKGSGSEGALWSEKSAGSELKRKSQTSLALETTNDLTNTEGLGEKWEPDVGLDSRRASKNSPDIRPNADTRFRRNTMGSAPTIDAAPVVGKEAFRSRGEPADSRSAPQTEESIELGLAYLIRQQLQDGSWTLHGVPQDDSGKGLLLSSDTAATGLAILAFQGAGFNHKEFKYASQMQSAIDWLVENQKESGELYIETNPYSDNVCRFYSHGIAALALCEAYGMTQDSNLRMPAQKALDYITATQNKKLGGWRYRSQSESDTSVTGWMMMAMQSGRLAGLSTDADTWDGIKRWLRLAQTPDQNFLFRYNPYALDKPTTRHGRKATPCMTSVGLLMNMYIGWSRQDPRFKQGAEYLLKNLPNDSTISQRDTYYWYYATQIMRHIGGEAWERWHRALHPMLVRSQIQNGEMAGSWDPLNPIPDRWGAQAGRLYVTTMNLLSLEVDYRLLPLYDETEQQE